MTSEEFARTVRQLSAKGRPCSFALLRDHSRRGGLRVARCVVVDSWEPLQAAAVEEIRRDVAHVLPFARLSKTARGVRRRAASFISFAASDEKSAAVCSLAGAGAA
jgi:RecA/RadA recombinase